MNESTTPTTVVSRIMFQNTFPMAFQSPQPAYICMPNMANMKHTINNLKPRVRTKCGIGRWGEYFDNILSYRLPRGQI